MLKVIINGCNGAMGKVLTKVIDETQDVEVVAGVDRNPNIYMHNYPVYSELSELKDKGDVIIDFSNPNCLGKLLDFGLKNEIPLVIATTGLSPKDLESIKNTSEKIPIFQSSNTSLGINVLINLVKKAGVILNELFDIEIIEKHHNNKIDAPSGTAYMIANEIKGVLDNSIKYKFGRVGNEEKRTKKEIGIHAIRGGTIPGEHTVIFAGMDEIIEIKHTALSKKIFAQGALLAARYVVNQNKGLYCMNDLINLD